MGHMVSHCERVLAYVDMAADGTITVKWLPDNAGYTPPTLVLRPDDRVYGGYMERLEGLRPGQRKPLMEYDGWVFMNEDGTLSVQFAGRFGGAAVSEGTARTVKPDEPYYHSLLERVHGLSPGQGKGISLKEGC